MATPSEEPKSGKQKNLTILLVSLGVILLIFQCSILNSRTTNPRIAQFLIWAIYLEIGLATAIWFNRLINRVKGHAPLRELWTYRILGGIFSLFGWPILIAFRWLFSAIFSVRGVDDLDLKVLDATMAVTGIMVVFSLIIAVIVKAGFIAVLGLILLGVGGIIWYRNNAAKSKPLPHISNSSISQQIASAPAQNNSPAKTASPIHTAPATVAGYSGLSNIADNTVKDKGKLKCCICGKDLTGLPAMVDHATGEAFCEQDAHYFGMHPSNRPKRPTIQETVQTEKKYSGYSKAVIYCRTDFEPRTIRLPGFTGSADVIRAGSTVEETEIVAAMLLKGCDKDNILLSVPDYGVGFIK